MYNKSKKCLFQANNKSYVIEEDPLGYDPIRSTDELALLIGRNANNFATAAFVYSYIF
ncbi:MAG: hypothetical protein P0S96_01500 [Simkaniaceae bacterium]|nr:hypothetical protein [Candidatus Sacchlamyda saccharinae]